MIYFDHNATTSISGKALKTMQDIYELGCCNPSSVHLMGKLAKKHLDSAREKILKTLNADGYDIIFTSSGTEANNLALNGKKILTTGIEHESIKNQKLQKKTLKVNYEGVVNEEDFKNSVDEYDCISIMWANNQTGVVQDLNKFIELKGKSLIHTDAVQYAGKKHIDLRSTPVDAITISGHKIHGPYGVGCLLLKKNFVVNSIIYGGSQENSLRAGTYNLPAIVGFATALEEVNSLEYLERYEYHTKMLMEYIANFVLENGGLVMCYESERISNTLCIAKKGVLTTEQLLIMDMNNICISAGSACSAGVVSKSYVLKEMGIDDEIISCSVRISVDLSNTMEEVYEFCRIWKNL